MSRAMRRNIMIHIVTPFSSADQMGNTKVTQELITDVLTENRMIPLLDEKMARKFTLSEFLQNGTLIDLSGDHCNFPCTYRFKKDDRSDCETLFDSKETSFREKTNNICNR